MKKEKVALSFSGGKDAMMALYRITQSNQYEVSHLVTTINQQYRRVVMQGVRESLVEAQASALGIPLIKVIMQDANNETYENQMQALFLTLQQKGINRIVYGDIFLEDLKSYRDGLLNKVNMSALYPLWKENTAELVREFLEKGFQALLACVDSRVFEECQVGIPFDDRFLKSLPETVDPAGENGEFHTFVTESPLFNAPLSIALGETVFRPISSDLSDTLPSKTKGFWYRDMQLL